MFRHALPAPALAIIAIALGPPTSEAAVQVPTDFTVDVLISSLDRPNSMALLPDGRVLFTEQTSGKVRMVVNGQIATTDPALVVPDVNVTGFERGLQGITVDPEWPARPYVYLFHNRIGDQIRVVRYTGHGDLDDPTGQSLTFDTPLLLLDDLPDAHRDHNAGCLRFDPGGYLFVSLGDDVDFCSATDSTSLKGQILRLRVSDLPAGGGGPVARAAITPASNPLSTPDSNAKLVWAYGMRNPWRFHIDPDNGMLYVADVGPDDFDEYNEVDPGDHCGWPYREGTLVIVRSDCPEPGGSGTNAYKAPFATFANVGGSTAISSAGVYRAVAGGTANWPLEYRGNAFHGEFYRGLLRRFIQQGNQWMPAPAVAGQPNPDDWATGLVAAVDFLVGPDGSLLVLRQFDDNFSGLSGSLIRIRYTGAQLDAGSAVDRALRLSASPSPFVTRVDLAFALSRAARVRLTVFDLSGRRLIRLRDDWLAAGAHRAVWDGRDEAGRAVAPGVYLARLERAGAIETVRLLRLR